MESPSGPFYVSTRQVPGPAPRELDSETAVARVPHDVELILNLDTRLSPSSAARTLVIPALADKFRMEGVTPDAWKNRGPVVFVQGPEPTLRDEPLPTAEGRQAREAVRQREAAAPVAGPAREVGAGVIIGSPVTIELLTQLVDDGSVENLILVAYVVAALGIDPAALRYRGGAACYAPVTPPLSLMGPRAGDPINAWFGFHGYVPDPERSSFVSGPADAGQTYRVFKLRVPNPEYAPYAILYAAPSRAAKIPRHFVAAQMALGDARGRAPRAGGPDRIPIPAFYVVPDIPDFAAIWAGLGPQRIFPALEAYFDLRKSGNVMYPRYIPSAPHDDTVPTFHPGPALYARISAPAAGRAAFFQSSGTHTDFGCVRESYHGDAVVQCPADPVRLGPI
jgi:hypothetical protein